MGIDEVVPSPAVFLDRDGVLNYNVFNPATGEYESPGRPSDFHLSPNVIPALHSLQRAGFKLFLISNQPNFAKGKSTLEELQEVHAMLRSALDESGIAFTEFYYCFHHPRGVVPSHSGPCDCRKPSPYFLNKAAAEHGISLQDSWLVGDRPSDIECGITGGLKTIRVREDHPAHREDGEPIADFEADHLSDAAAIILAAAAVTSSV